MNLLNLIRHGAISDVAGVATAKAANSANDGVFKAPTNSGLAKLAGLAVASPLSETSKQWQEFEALLAIVGPAYDTPAHEYEWAREAAQDDLEAALVSYREMAAQIPHMRRRVG